MLRDSMVSDSPGTGKYVRKPPPLQKNQIARVGHTDSPKGKRLAHLPKAPPLSAGADKDRAPANSLC